MATVTFDIATFREAFPEFSSTEQYPNAVLEGFWQEAICALSPNACECDLACRTRMLNLTVAHMAKLETLDADGGAGIVQSATIDKVSVSVAAPPFGTSQWKYWLNLTNYGQRLLAMMSAKSVGGRYVGGSTERSGFRKSGGKF